MTVIEMVTGPRGYQKKLAQATGLSQAQLCLLAKGKRNLTLPVASILARACRAKLALTNGVFKFVPRDGKARRLFKLLPAQTQGTKIKEGNR